MWIISLFFPVGYLTPDSSPILPDESSVFLIGANLLQFAVSRWLDGRYDHGLGKNYFWMIWYPFFYWFLNLITAVTALPKVLFGTGSGAVGKPRSGSSSGTQQTRKKRSWITYADHQ